MPVRQRVSIYAEGGGYGRKTVAQICRQYDISVDDGVKRLKDNSINAEADHNLKELAEFYQKTPIALVKIITCEVE